MKGNIRRIYSVFDGNSKQLVIPVYQRNYDWGESQCARLFDDLVDLIDHRRDTHFFGAVVGNPEDSFTYVVIDGQQRLTTTSLLMLALVNSLDAGVVSSVKDPDLGKKIRSNYLELSDQGHGAKFKLKPVKDDNEAYRRVLSGDAHLLEESSVTANYRYFMDRIARQELSGDDLWQAIQNLEVMVLDLEKNDDPQRIFESLNSTGLELSEADKIRNIVLMGLPAAQQEELYEHYWNKIEKNVDHQTDTFIRQFLISRTRKTPRKDRLYETFREYQATSQLSTPDLLGDMRRYSEHAKQISTATTGFTKADRRLRRFNLMRRDVAMPFFMAVMDDVRASVLTDTQLADTVRIIDVYVFRRFVCEVQSHGLNKIFATLYGDVRKLSPTADTFVDALTYLLTRRETGSGRFPGDATFVEAFATRNFYNIPTPTRLYLFECLENQNSNDTHDIAHALETQSLTVEHVMPQTLTQSWRKELGPEPDKVHAEWVNRIGNLTVTGYNSSYSNASFTEKVNRVDGFNDTPYRLNKEMRAVSTWGPQQMQQRAARLCAEALAYWPMPTTEFEPTVEPMPTEPMSDEGSFRNRTITAFEFGGARRTVQSWSDMMIQVLRDLLVDRREQLFAIADTDPGLAVSESSPRYFAEVSPGLHANTQNTTDARVAILRRIFDALGIDTADLVFVLAPQSDASTTVDLQEIQRPYPTITKFIPGLRELAGTNLDAAETADIRAEICESLAPYVIPDPLPILDGHGYPAVLDHDFVANASNEQVFATASLLYQLDTMMPGKIHECVIDGSLLRLLEHLT